MFFKVHATDMLTDIDIWNDRGARDWWISSFVPVIVTSVLLECGIRNHFWRPRACPGGFRIERKLWWCVRKCNTSSNTGFLAATFLREMRCQFIDHNWMAVVFSEVTIDNTFQSSFQNNLYQNWDTILGARITLYQSLVASFVAAEK